MENNRNTMENNNINQLIDNIRKDFPILSQKVYGKPLVYLDNAASTQKPLSVIEKTSEYYRCTNANIHRGVHYLSEKATKEYEESRKIIKSFINAESDKEIIFTRGTTESINLVASSYGKKFLKKGDEVLISHMEHHSNIVPWQLICQEKGAILKVIPINDKGEIIFEEFEKLISEKTKFLSLVHISNSLGTINPIKRMIEKAKEYNIPVLIDAAQSIQHFPIDVNDLKCDFLAFSGHKIYGPTGIGVLYGKSELLEEMPPYQGGGDMIRSVTFEKTLYNDLPYKFEAGTPNIAGGIVLADAIKYINKIGLDTIQTLESELLNYAQKKLMEILELKIIGNAENKASLVSFVLDNIHPHDVGTLCDQDGVAIRTGHHCTEPVMRRFGIPATSRASFAFYNTKEEIDILAESLRKIIKLFS